MKVSLPKLLEKEYGQKVKGIKSYRFVCEACLTRFKTKTNLTRHLKYEHKVDINWNSI
jgi:rRNA maturation endonuclease Nob1